MEYYKKLWQIASGISEIHSVGIIHRDIKPNNMKLDPEGIIKIYDFGLARSGFDAATVGFIGTQGFAAPELFAANPTFTNAIDVYAFGATALFLATGTLPNELIYANGRPVSQSHFNVIPLSIETEVINTLNQCLFFSPDQRPTISAIRDILAKYISFDQHQALVVHRAAASYLNATNRTIALELHGIGRIVIEYNGSSFIATEVNKEVFINNKAIQPGEELPGSCVVALGVPQRKADREFITFDISHPEIVL
ncbi:Protein kinase domain protein [compost metagenome]